MAGGRLILSDSLIQSRMDGFRGRKHYYVKRSASCEVFLQLVDLTRLFLLLRSNSYPITFKDIPPPSVLTVCDFGSACPLWHSNRVYKYLYISPLNIRSSRTTVPIDICRTTRDKTYHRGSVSALTASRLCKAMSGHFAQYAYASCLEILMRPEP